MKPLTRPVIFAFHVPPWLTHRWTYHTNLHVHGNMEEGTTSPFDMCVLNQIGRFNLVKGVIARVHGAAGRGRHERYIAELGDDLPELRNWMWGRPGISQTPLGRRGWLACTERRAAATLFSNSGGTAFR